MDWSVLTSPDANLTEEARDALAKLDANARRSLSERLGTIVNQQLEKDIHPWFSRNVHDWADVDVYAAELRDGVLVLHFIADHYNYNFAQSGSDWADHYIFGGEAHLVGGRLRSQTFSLARHVHLTEHQSDDYHLQPIVDLVREELRAKLREQTPDPRPFDAAIAAVEKSSEDRASAARAKAREERTTPAAPRPKQHRCPTCKSDDVRVELLFDAYKLACGACGHTAIFETYPDQDDDSEWQA